MTLQHQRFKVGAGGINSGGKAGAAGAEDNGIAYVF
jgi:hypothetical protein